MNFAPPATSRYTAFTVGPAPSPIGARLRSLLRRHFPVATRSPARRDRSSEAAEVRAYAMSVRNSDPGFASDLFAAADRHELIQD